MDYFNCIARSARHLSALSTQARDGLPLSPRPLQLAQLAQFDQSLPPCPTRQPRPIRFRYRTLSPSFPPNFAIKKCFAASSHPTANAQSGLPTSTVASSGNSSAAPSPRPSALSYLPSSGRGTERLRPIMVIDHDKNDSTRILNEYLRYRLATSPDDATALSITPRSARIRIKTPRVRHITYRQADSLRGSTPSFILMTDAQDACSFSPFRKRPAGFLRLCRALFPILYGVGFIVIHMRADSPPAHAPAISECDSTPPPQAPDLPPVTVITLTSITDDPLINLTEPKAESTPHPRPL